jgi:hypothetical protein
MCGIDNSGKPKFSVASINTAALRASPLRDEGLLRRGSFDPQPTCPTEARLSPTSSQTLVRLRRREQWRSFPRVRLDSSGNSIRKMSDALLTA